MSNFRMLINNIINSFQKVKTEVMDVEMRVKQLETRMSDLQEAQEQLLMNFAHLKTQQGAQKAALEEKRTPVIIKTEPIVIKAPEKNALVIHTTTKKKTTYIASKTSNKLHIENCIFARNVIPKNRLVFKSKTKALNAGFKLCDCLKKV